MTNSLYDFIDLGLIFNVTVVVKSAKLRQNHAYAHYLKFIWKDNPVMYDTWFIRYVTLISFSRSLQGQKC